MKKADVGFIIVIALAVIAGLIIIQALLPIVIAVAVAYFIGRYVYLPLGLGVGVFIFVAWQLHSSWPGFIAGVIVAILTVIIMNKLGQTDTN